MPIYEYECLNCNKIHEFIQKFSDEPLKSCPICGGELRKLISQSSFILKGSGWYVTDYVRKNNSNNGSNGKKSKDTEKTNVSQEKSDGKVNS
ncbi:FmdB family zinc ribbon protein [Thermodesulfovibrio sp.]|jgi:putative FmdB family regulatory protein|uniref:FmdB family zinc ribbon protein n=1 Tax=Thermodesulfovibrio TaxID=28261 RepID=UPI002636F125|nr:FmdB family zinc ribbon protein [Thermodesulfovibrio sp.]